MPRILLFLLLAAIVPGEIPGRADTGPLPPCGEAAFPSYPDVDQPPEVRVWEDGAYGRDWTPPSCTGWTTSGFTTLVETVGRFRHSGGIEDLLRRIGAISERAGIRYWSTTRKRWRTLISGACALRGPLDNRCRNDFSPDEMGEGKALYFRQEDNVLGKVVYRMRVRSVSPGRLVLEAENAGAVRNLLVPLFHPGEIQSLYFLERESPNVWRYYGILRIAKGANALTAGHEASHVNRAVAFFRFLAGIPTDQEPPAAR